MHTSTPRNPPALMRIYTDGERGVLVNSMILRSTNLEICGADREDQLVGLEQTPAGRQNYVRQERLLAQRLHIVTENRMVIIPFETKVLRGHGSSSLLHT